MKNVSWISGVSRLPCPVRTQAVILHRMGYIHYARLFLFRLLEKRHNLSARPRTIVVLLLMYRIIAPCYEYKAGVKAKFSPFPRVFLE